MWNSRDLPILKFVLIMFIALWDSWGFDNNLHFVIINILNNDVLFFFSVLATVAFAFLLLPMCQYVMRPCYHNNKWVFEYFDLWELKFGVTWFVHFCSIWLPFNIFVCQSEIFFHVLVRVHVMGQILIRKSEIWFTGLKSSKKYKKFNE